jgi:hypothetical protein
VLDGRHRVAAASALDMPVRVDTFQGDEAAARDHVISLNVKRRHLTMAQRGLIVQELYLPEAEAKAKERQLAGTTNRTNTLGRNRPKVSESIKAIEDAAKQSQGLANVSTLRDMVPVRDAPKTQERIRSGEIKTVQKAREEALKETGRDKTEPERLPAVRTETAYRLLGRALEKVQSACDSIEADHRGKNRGGGDVSDGQIVTRINEIRTHLDRAEQLVTNAGPDG